MNNVEKRIKIYTSYENYQSLNTEKLVFYHYSDMDNDKYLWAKEMLNNRLNQETRGERFFHNLFNGSITEICNEVFFLIGDKMYFLDFFLPKYKVAFEIDGLSHASNKAQIKDFLRDNHFEKIGIYTLRYTDKDLRDKNIKQRINSDVKTIINGDYSFKIDNFSQCITNKFYNKKTHNQKVLDAMFEDIKILPDNITLVMITNILHLSTVMNYRDIERKKHVWLNYERIESIHKLLREKNIEWRMLISLDKSYHREKNKNIISNLGHIDMYMEVNISKDTLVKSYDFKDGVLSNLLPQKRKGGNSKKNKRLFKVNDLVFVKGSRKRWTIIELLKNNRCNLWHPKGGIITEKYYKLEPYVRSNKIKNQLK